MVLLLLYGLGGLLVLGGGLYFTTAAPVADRWFNTTATEPPYDASDRAREIHEALVVADLHNDLLLWARDPLRRYDHGHSDVPRLREGGVDLQVFAAVTQVPGGSSHDGWDRLPYLLAAQRWPLRTWTSPLQRALYQAQKLRDAAARDDRLALVRTTNDLEDVLARRDDAPGEMGTLLAVEGLHALEGEVAHVDTLVDAGYRMMSLTHLHDNALGGASTGREKGGLTKFGREVLRRLEAHEVLLDLAHASEALIDDVLARTDRPVVVSHTGVKATYPSSRNLSDRHIQAIAREGGVIGIGFWRRVLGEATPEAIVRAVRHVAKLVGVEHVALGSDFDGTVTPPFDATGLPQLTEALLAAGFSKEELQQIMGGNVVRLLHRTLPSGN